MLESYKRISFLFFWAEFGPRVDQAIEPIKISFERDIKSPREGEQAESGQCLPAASPGHGQRHSEFEPIRSGGYHECWRGSRENGIHCSTSQHYLYWVFHCFKCFIDLSFWTACLIFFFLIKEDDISTDKKRDRRWSKKCEKLLNSKVINLLYVEIGAL